MSAANETGPVLWSVDARGIARVALNRPEVNNAYDGTMIDGLLAALDALAAVPGLRAVVITGRGKHFQAGADLKWIDAVRKSSPEENLRASRTTALAVRRLNAVPVPTVALVQGGCFGGGTGLVAACDIAIAADNAVFSIAEVRWGLTGSIIVPQLNDAIGVRQVRRYALTGERFGAEEARRIGLVHEIVPLAELEGAGERIVGHLLANAPDAVAQTKTVALASAFGHPEEAAFARLVQMHADKRQSDEAGEGLASFRAGLVRGETRGALGEVMNARRFRWLRLLGLLAGLMSAQLPAAAAEPVRRIGIYVQPYYEAAPAPDAAPRVAVGKSFDELLASLRREDILAARDKLMAQPARVTPMTMMVLAIRLYEVGLRDDAVFWFYAAKDRAVIFADVIDTRGPALAGAMQAVASFATLAGPAINGYAFCDLGRQRRLRAETLAWVEANPYAPVFMPQLPARAADRKAALARAVADARTNAEKERVFFEDAKNVESFRAARKKNEMDEKYCWK